MLRKGKVSAVLDGGQTVTVTPYLGGTVTMPLVVPDSMRGLLAVNTPVMYHIFEDNTGIVLSRMDGRSGVSLSVTTDGDAIVINTK